MVRQKSSEKFQFFMERNRKIGIETSEYIHYKLMWMKETCEWSLRMRYVGLEVLLRGIRTSLAYIYIDIHICVCVYCIYDIWYAWITV